MTKVKVFEVAGDFAENKDFARKLRLEKIMPSLQAGEAVQIDFSKVSLSTQSFVHALISDALRKHGPEVLDLMSFKGCNPAIKALISTVCDYMQDTGHDSSAHAEGPTGRWRHKPLGSEGPPSPQGQVLSFKL